MKRVATGVALLLAGCALLQPPAFGPGSAPLVIAHRGASGALPEHTLEAYALAIDQGADLIEPDLVATKDHVLIARHEANLALSSDVAERPQFASRRAKRAIDGKDEEGFFASDFTLAEIRTLRATQRFPDRPRQYDGSFGIPTFDEVIALAQRESRRRGRPIGVYPETKHAAYHRTLGLPLEDKLLASLRAAGWNHAGAPVFIQSFEAASLRELRAKTKLRLVQLVGASGDLLTPAGLAEVKSYADGIAPWKRHLVGTQPLVLGADGKPRDANGDSVVDERDFAAMPRPELAERIRRAGLLLHTWTLRDEPRWLAADYGGDPAREVTQLFELGVDGVFSDFPASAVAARDAFVNKAR